MNWELLVFVLLYLLGTLAIGAWAGTRVKNTEDFAVAGHSLPLYMVITTSFATWFGAETVMGIPAKFVEGGLNSVIEDPFGASMCLVLVGLFFATRLYRMKLLTIGDFYRKRFGTPVEILCSIMIIISYLGWVAAQITALGLVFTILSGGEINHATGMIIGTVLVLVYVMMGGMLAVAWTDFIQMIVLVIGLSYIAWYASGLVGGADKVFAYASEKDWFKILPPPSFKDWAFFIAAAITMMLGSIPQQDVFQRVMSAKDERSAKLGAVIGGLCYLAFAFVPMFIVVAALIQMPEHSKELLESDPQRVLPKMILDHMPLFAQILFFGALVSAIKSCSSATLLAPSTSFVENILRHIYPHLRDKQLLLAMRITIFVFTSLVLTYAILTQGTPIYELVSNAYQVTLAGSFVPLTAGLYWRRATTQGAIFSIVLGVLSWAVVTFCNSIPIAALQGIDEVFPAQLVALGFAVFGMVFGSLGPQWIKNICHINLNYLGIVPIEEQPTAHSHHHSH
jgi:SSS family transporter